QHQQGMHLHGCTSKAKLQTGVWLPFDCTFETFVKIHAVHKILPVSSRAEPSGLWLWNIASSGRYMIMQVMHTRSKTAVSVQWHIQTNVVSPAGNPACKSCIKT
ncbi:hypothetical protein RZS08_54235, partial [Arthrospira platensis SPKY1]|nr:hypothetical protein [Arthrospira platensis SPKY1]